MKPGTAEDRAKDVQPFVKSIIEGIALGSVAAVDVRAYKLPTLHKIRLNVSEDPHYFAFYLSISSALQHVRIPKDYTVGLILDEDEAKAIQVYKFLLRMKKANAEVKRRIPSICFMDDSQSPQLQAVDLFANLCRLASEEKFLGKPNPYSSLCGFFNPPGTTGKEKLDICGGLYGERQLRDYLESREA